MPYLSIIIPILNEASLLRRSSALLQQLHDAYELILVDGGSEDDSVRYAQSQGFTVISSDSGRGLQLAAGVQSSHSAFLAFMHLDCSLELPHFVAIYQTLQGAVWGRFDVRFVERHLVLKLIAASMNLRSRLTAIATGDQLIFCQREAYLKEAANAMKNYPLMEDIYLSQCLKRVAKPRCLKMKVTISARYWQKNGIIKGMLTMWFFRALFFFGVSPERLYRGYYSASKENNPPL